jgi:HTH-type transcriptional regulator/antitoxin HigA
MIYSDKQQAVSSTQLSKLRSALLVAQKRTVDQEWIKQAEINALESQIADIDAELMEYARLKSGEVSFAKTYSFEELPRMLTQARIASGMSQTDLAAKLDMKPQQIQRYEASEYMGASLARLIEVAHVLGVNVSGSFEGPSRTSDAVFMWGDADDVMWSQFPYKEMVKRKWLDVPRGADPKKRIKDYFLRAAGPQFATALHRKKMYGGRTPNEFALLAWQARILERARAEIDAGGIGEFELGDDRWVPDLVRLTAQQDGPVLARDFLAEKGIALVVEAHLSGSYLDGAAMCAASGVPVIGLTLRHDRLDNFWFVLMHELGHVLLHLFDGRRFDFFDEEKASNGDVIELEADTFALNSLIPEDAWNQCFSRFTLTEEAVRFDADALNINPAIIAGRIRKELGNYTILSDLVGQGTIRLQFDDHDR